MNDKDISIKLLIYTTIFSAAVVFILFIINNRSDRTIIVFCDVGQGDATYMRIKNQIDVLIDAGPDNSVLQCLGKYMPFFDKTIELAFITHPQKDHYHGFIGIQDRYQIQNFFINPITSSNESFITLIEKIKNHNTAVNFPTQGTRIEALGSYFTFFWPTAEYLANNISRDEIADSYKKNSSARDLNSFLGTTSLDPNLFSFIFTFQEQDVRVLFTGDSTGIILNTLLEKAELKSTILKVPHHGSKNGLTAEFLQLADPILSVISLAKNNRYGHPSPEILDLFKKFNNTYLRTDQEGNLVFKIGDNIVERIK